MHFLTENSHLFPIEFVNRVHKDGTDQQCIRYNIVPKFVPCLFDPEYDCGVYARDLTVNDMKDREANKIPKITIN